MIISNIINSALLLIVIALFASFGLKSLRKKNDMVGNPPINKAVFLFGKISNFSCWGIFIYKTLETFFIAQTDLSLLNILSTISLAISTILIFLSFKHLGNLNRFGLPSEKTKIINTGIYSISRNPMYLGFFLLNISSALYYPHPVNIFLAAIGIIIHHMIVLGEERFMSGQFGTAWSEYTGRVRRYI